MGVAAVGDARYVGREPWVYAANGECAVRLGALVHADGPHIVAQLRRHKLVEYVFFAALSKTLRVSERHTPSTPQQQRASHA